MLRSCGETTLGFPLGPLCMLEADWVGAEAQPRPWAPRVLPRRTLGKSPFLLRGPRGTPGPSQLLLHCQHPGI